MKWIHTAGRGFETPRSTGAGYSLPPEGGSHPVKTRACLAGARGAKARAKAGL
jgi:hypothetical protein